MSQASWQPKLCGVFPCMVQPSAEGSGCLLVDVNPTGGYAIRYCYPTEADAVFAINTWDGVGHPPGPWLKVTGVIDGRVINEYGPGMKQS